jgi:excinuclease UvrABC nuclease subunit
VAWVSCEGVFRCDLWHLQAARRLWPNRYRQHVALPKCHFVRIDLASRHAHFSVQPHAVTDRPEEHVFGLFPSRKAAERFVEILVTAFGLCRRPDLLAAPERAPSCPYLQMGTCPAPCVGRISEEAYRQRVFQAVEAASGEHRRIYEELLARMHEYARSQHFEQAQQIKETTEALAGLQAVTYAWTANLRRLRILHIEPSGRIRTPGKRRTTQTFAVFLIHAGRILEGPDVMREELVAMDEYLADLEAKTVPSDLTEIEENLALVSSHLFCSKPKDIWLNITDGLPGNDDLTALLETHFGPDSTYGSRRAH